MDTPVYQELSWHSFGGGGTTASALAAAAASKKTAEYRSLEQRRNAIIQSLQQTPSNRIELEQELHQVQIEIYMFQSRHDNRDYGASGGDIMEKLGVPQTETAGWPKQFDSGIASGTTTSPPSEDGGNADYQAAIEEDLQNLPAFEWESYSYGGQSRSERLRAELFPDTGESEQTASYQSLEPLSHLELQSQLYQGDTQLVSQAMGEFAKLLNHPSREVLLSVTTCLHELSKKEVKSIVSEGTILPALLRILSTCPDKEVTRCCSGVLYNLSKSREGMEAIQSYRGIAIMCDLLNSTSEHVLFYTVNALHNLIQKQQSSHMAVFLSGGLEKMVAVLKYLDKPQLAALVAECLYLICHRSPDKKQSLISCNGPLLLVNQLHNSTLEYLSWAVARVLKTLSVCPHNKRAIIEAGGMQTLARHLDNGSQRVTEEVLYAMRNLSNMVAALSIETIDPILTRLMDVLARTNINFIACSVGCLSNLTCSNPSNKRMVFRAGGMDTLLRCLVHHQSIASIAEPLLCTLRHINYKHSESEQTQHAFRSSGGISLVAKVLMTAQHWAVIKAACGLIRNLSQNPANMPLYRETGLMLHLTQTCLRITDLYKGGFSEVRDGIRLEDIMRECLHALERSSHFSREIRSQLDNPTTVHLLLRCVASHHELLVRESLAVCLLYEHHDNFMSLLRARPELLTSLCHTRNGPVAQLATRLVARLGLGGGVGGGSGTAVAGSAKHGSEPRWMDSDVVDLDTTTAQHRGGEKSPYPACSQYTPYNGWYPNI